jgi:hypothetical protein
MDETPTIKAAETKPKKSRAKISIIILIILLLAAIAGSGWLFWQNNQQNAQFNKERSDLQARISELNSKITAPSSDSTTSEPCCNGTVPQSTKDAIRTAITSHDYGPLESLMASSVRSVVAASEYGPTVTPAQAIVDLRRLNDAAAPWDFNLPTATIDDYKASEYKDYFKATSFVARSADGMVVSINFDDCGKINGIFISIVL